MKTLADLKRNAHLYLWSLKENSWFKQIPTFQAAYRKVGRVQSSKLSLGTDKGNQLTESWIDFPKSSELQLINLGQERFAIIIKCDCGSDRPPHIMIYELKRA
jgi:hypothetical protein